MYTELSNWSKEEIGNLKAVKICKVGNIASEKTSDRSANSTCQPSLPFSPQPHEILGEEEHVLDNPQGSF